jgi:DNA polymerase I-like protein with 3'-5' exonuclease and polymerase domains
MDTISFDSIAEIRYTHNGGPASRQDSSTQLAVQMAWQADLNPPTEQRRQYLTKRCPAEFGQHAGASPRLFVVESCMRRFNRGIAVDRNGLNQLRSESERYVLEYAGNVPGNVIDRFGAIDSQRLAEILPDRVKAHWPKDKNGLFLTDTTSLEQIGNAYSRALLATKRQHRDWALHNITVEDDGRHRSWPNPFGTITGRENPKGPSFARLSRDQRQVLVPANAHVLVTLDFQQQEPAIALYFAHDNELLQAYQADDLYSHIASRIPGDLGRETAKTLVISFLYGATASTLIRKLDMSLGIAAECMAALKHIFARYRTWSDRYLQQAYAGGRVTCLDWQMVVHPGTRTATVRNWPIQAAGADILRRVCLKLDEADITIVGCLHDSVLIEVPLAGYELAIQRAQSLMANASAEVLDGFRLKSTVESTVFPSVITAGGYENE